MYIPKNFVEHNWSEISQLIREFSFAILVSVKDHLPVASHIPLQLLPLEKGGWSLSGHLSKANPQWKTFEANPQVLAIFTGPHAYVSPSWYNHKNVPTWNYQAVHMYGEIRFLQGEELKTRMGNMMSQYEHFHAENPLEMADLPTTLLERDLSGIVVFDIKIEKVEAVSKLSQNRDAESYQSVIDHLKTSDAYNSKQIAEEMEKRKK